MTDQPNRLKTLLQARHLHSYSAFCREYDRVAKGIDPKLVGGHPSKAQFHRWLSGDVKRLPYADHCRVLEALLPGWTAGQLFEPAPVEQTEAVVPRQHTASASGPLDILAAQGFADLAAVFPSRSEFTSKIPPHVLFDGATQLRLAGISLNILCQQYADEQLRNLIAGGATVQCLFLNPEGDAIRAREQEEGLHPGTLVNLTQLNMRTLTDRVRRRLPEQARERLVIATYDETIRFNLTLVDDHTAAVQPYLHGSRGVEAPTLMIRNNSGPGLYTIFEKMYAWLWDRSTHL